MIVMKCDKCGRLSEPAEQEHNVKGFTRIRLNIGYAGSVRKDLCDECRKALGLPAEKTQETIGDRLVEILSELAQDAVQQ